MSGPTPEQLALALQAREWPAGDKLDEAIDDIFGFKHPKPDYRGRRRSNRWSRDVGDALFLAGMPEHHGELRLTIKDHGGSRQHCLVEIDEREQRWTCIGEAKYPAHAICRAVLHWEDPPLNGPSNELN